MFGGTRARSDKWQKRPLELATQLSKHSWKNSRCCVQDLKWYPKGSMPGKYCFKNKELYIIKKSLCKYIYINIELPRCRFSTQASQQVRKKQRINSFETPNHDLCDHHLACQKRCNLLQLTMEWNQILGLTNRSTDANKVRRSGGVCLEPARQAHHGKPIWSCKNL